MEHVQQPDHSPADRVEPPIVHYRASRDLPNQLLQLGAGIQHELVTDFFVRGNGQLRRREINGDIAVLRKFLVFGHDHAIGLFDGALLKLVAERHHQRGEIQHIDADVLDKPLGKVGFRGLDLCTLGIQLQRGCFVFNGVLAVFFFELLLSRGKLLLQQLHLGRMCRLNLFHHFARRQLALIDTLAVFVEEAHPHVAVLVGVVGVFQRYSHRTAQRVAQLLRARRQVFQRDRQLELIAARQRVARVGLLQFFSSEFIEFVMLRQLPAAVGRLQSKRDRVFGLRGDLPGSAVE